MQRFTYTYKVYVSLTLFMPTHICNFYLILTATKPIQIPYITQPTISFDITKPHYKRQFHKRNDN